MKPDIAIVGAGAAGLAVAAMSYLGKIHFGLIGDWDLMPDLSDFAADLDTSMAELRTAATRR